MIVFLVIFWGNGVVGFPQITQHQMLFVIGLRGQNRVYFTTAEDIKNQYGLVGGDRPATFAHEDRDGNIGFITGILHRCHHVVSVVLHVVVFRGGEIIF